MNMKDRLLNGTVFFFLKMYHDPVPFLIDGG
jgi:hypothetical protein